MVLDIECDDCKGIMGMTITQLILCEVCGKTVCPVCYEQRHESVLPFDEGVATGGNKCTTDQ